MNEGAADLCELVCLKRIKILGRGVQGGVPLPVVNSSNFKLSLFGKAIKLGGKRRTASWASSPPQSFFLSARLKIGD